MKKTGSNKVIRLAIIVGVIVIVIWLLFWWSFTSFYDIEDTDISAGEMGDLFGIFNALFTALAFGAAALAIYLQSHELGEQRKELSFTRFEFELNRTTNVILNQLGLAESKKLILNKNLNSDIVHFTNLSDYLNGFKINSTDELRTFDKASISTLNARLELVLDYSELYLPAIRTFRTIEKYYSDSERMKEFDEKTVHLQIQIIRNIIEGQIPKVYLGVSDKLKSNEFIKNHMKDMRYKSVIENLFKLDMK